MKSTFLLAGLALLVATAAAEARVYRCVDAEGRITFTDVACPSGGVGDEMKVRGGAPADAAAKGRGGKGGRGSKGGGSAAEFSEALKEAREKCAEGLLTFLRSRRQIPAEATAEITGVVDRYLRPERSEVRYKGEVTYADGPATMRAEVECLAGREGQGPWSVEYEEGVTHSYIQFQ